MGRDDDETERRLADVDAKISRHPLASTPVTEAFAVIEKHGKEQQDAIAQELRDRDLPALEELGRLQVRGSFSWWKLHRDRRALLKKLGRTDDA
jgi:hypothetical protein